MIIQAKFFGIDLLCQAILSNHFHLVPRSRHDVVAEWDDTEVARRWLMLCPADRDENRQPIPPPEFELNRLRNNKEKLAEIRTRLSDISWWMRLLSQNIAQRANFEDGEIGKFWQARFRGVRLLDETAILACAAYVDLNPIRAALVETIEDSDFTSAQKRAEELKSRISGDGVRVSGKKETQGAKRPARHLAPVDLKERTTNQLATVTELVSKLASCLRRRKREMFSLPAAIGSRSALKRVDVHQALRMNCREGRLLC